MAKSALPVAVGKPNAITHPNLRSGWEELLGKPVDLGSEQHRHRKQFHFEGGGGGNVIYTATRQSALY